MSTYDINVNHAQTSSVGSAFNNETRSRGAAFMRRVWRAFVIGRTTTALNQLTDRQLHDIGINRADIPKVARDLA